ncbi:MAG: hypothetical protein ACRBB0_08930 [Pelagimonas sp.]|uniref:hypothetical protein n=1 Tax=Pelagimonas sp. TaxID=2073170 RepID=UPI003D6B90C4
MSSPYIIWTLRRTGGTTLAGLLATLSEHPGVEHEPFNPERLFGEVTKGWLEHGDEAQLRADLRGVLATRLPVIKHCHELLPDAFNRVLMEVSIELGYAQIILDRDAEVDRILSLELARLTGAWGKQEAGQVFADLKKGALEIPPFDVARAEKHLRFCQDRRRNLKLLCESLGVAPFVVLFEQVYAVPREGRKKVAELLAFLGINPAEHAGYHDLLTEALLKKGQKSGRILDFVPNLEETRTQLTTALGPEPVRF